MRSLCIARCEAAVCSREVLCFCGDYSACWRCCTRISVETFALKRQYCLDLAAQSCVVCQMSEHKDLHRRQMRIYIY